MVGWRNDHEAREIKAAVNQKERLACMYDHVLDQDRPVLLVAHEGGLGSFCAANPTALSPCLAWWA
jgi:hypothetical protein